MNSRDRPPTTNKARENWGFRPSRRLFFTNSIASWFLYTGWIMVRYTVRYFHSPAQSAMKWHDLLMSLLSLRAHLFLLAFMCLYYSRICSAAQPPLSETTRNITSIRSGSFTGPTNASNELALITTNFFLLRTMYEICQSSLRGLLRTNYAPSQKVTRGLLTL